MTPIERRRLAPFRRAQLRTHGRSSLSHSEHDAVAKSIIACNASTADAAIFNRVGLTEDAYTQFTSRPIKTTRAREYRVLWV